MENIDNENTTSSNGGRHLNATESTHEASVSLPASQSQLPDATPSVDHDSTSQAVEEALEKKPSDVFNADLPAVKIETSTSLSSAASGSSTGHYVPPIKRFSAVNINKKFLEKASSSSSSSSGHVASSGMRQSGSIAKPAPQQAPTHSKLITTKLTAAPLSTSPGPGWSRPSSVTPPAPSPSSVSAPLSNGPSQSSASQGPPQLPLPGKVIQPQVRGSVKLKLEYSGGPGRPAWRNLQAGALKSEFVGGEDFPTAAEAAKALATKVLDAKVASDAAAAQKQLMTETADTFRGVHLDPNAHHWDDMEEDDNDDFLGGVIEFGDGRQYTIKVNDGPGLEDVREEDSSLSQLAGARNIRKEDRFVDDFDRSWPRTNERDLQGSSLTRSHLSNSRKPANSETSSVTSASPTSLRDGNQSRVLFNERLNRMEPYSGQSNSHQYHPPLTTRRDSSSGMDRDAPPHGTFHPTHVLQKPPRNYDGKVDRREHDDAVSVTSHSSADGVRDPWRNRRASGTASIRGRSLSRDGTSSAVQASASSSITGALETSAEKGAEKSARNPWASRTSPAQSSTNERLGEQSTSFQVRPTSTSHESRDFHSTAPRRFSTTSSQDHSERSVPVESLRNETTKELNKAPGALAPDVEAIQKAVLQDSAERAKKRRQQEEEERAKAQERARKKAAELEAKMSALKIGSNRETSVVSEKEASLSDGKQQPLPSNPDERDVLDVIEEAIRSAVSSEISNIESNPLKRDETNPDLPERLEDWRKPPSSTVPKADASVLPEVHNFDVQLSDDMEVVEFTDLARFVDDEGKGADQSDSHSLTNRLKRSRPVASDFFKDEPQPSEQAKLDSSWRRPPPSESELDGNLHVGSRLSTLSFNHGPLTTELSTPSKGNASEQASSQTVRTVQRPPSLDSSSMHNAQQYPHARFPKSPSTPFRKAPLSTLDDTMSRIKGALDVMQSSHLAESKSEPRDSPSLPRKEKWVPPQLRPNFVGYRHTVPTLFASSQPEPPRTPLPSGEDISVRLPQSSRRIESLSKRQMNLWKAFPGPVRWEILSFNPPVEGMTKRNLSVNDVLFKKPQGFYKANFRYRVVLPKVKRNGGLPGHFINRTPTSRPVTAKEEGDHSLASTKGVGPFTRPKMADQDNWRNPAKQSVSPSAEESSSTPTESSTLSITSRSPPPEPSLVKETLQSPNQPVLSRTTSLPWKSKGPHMAEGTDVAFYRDVFKAPPSVTFTVRSELDMDSLPLDSNNDEVDSKGTGKSDVEGFCFKDMVEPVEKSKGSQKARGSNEKLASVESKILSVREEGEKVEHANKDFSSIKSLSWSKSTSRTLDPEHLKAVWSQASDKEVSTTNSLKGIADDLSTVPFSIHEVKSEDGGTPPPSGSAVTPSRMSASDVTRAFQTVPPASSNSLTPPSLRNGGFSSALTSPMGMSKSLKPTPSVNGQQPPQSLRPSYVAYSSPLTSHSPSPTLIYPTHLPNGMQTAAPGAGYHAVWMPFGPQPPSQLTRQPSSPYSASVMPYHPPAQNGMFQGPASPHNQPNGPMAYAGAPPSQLMVSPVLSQAPPVPGHMQMYAPSPVLVALPPPGSNQAQHFSPAGGMGRSFVHGRGPQDGRPHHGHGNVPPSGTRYPQNSGFSHVPPQSFVRPAW